MHLSFLEFFVSFKSQSLPQGNMTFSKTKMYFPTITMQSFNFNLKLIFRPTYFMLRTQSYQIRATTNSFPWPTYLVFNFLMFVLILIFWQFKYNAMASLAFRTCVLMIIKSFLELINQSINNNIFYFHQCTLLKEILT